MGPVPLRKVASLGAAAVLLIALAGCEPIINAPPGGGQVVQATFTIGPFNLAPEGQAGSESEAAQANVPRPTGAFGIKTMNFDIVDAAGAPVPHSAVHLHHVLLMDNARRDPLCNRAQRFAGSGSERTPISLPGPYAYMVGASDRWDALWHVMNTSDTARQVYIQYTIGYQPGATAQNTRAVTPFFLDITGCGNSVYDVPGDGGPGSVFTSTRSWGATTSTATATLPARSRDAPSSPGCCRASRSRSSRATTSPLNKTSWASCWPTPGRAPSNHRGCRWSEMCLTH